MTEELHVATCDSIFEANRKSSPPPPAKPYPPENMKPSRINRKAKRTWKRGRE